MNNNFDRLFALAQKTNSTLVVYDRDGENHCVVLGIEQFEKLSGDTNKIPEEKVLKAPVVAQPEIAVDPDLKSDEAVIEALNQKIAEWRAAQLASQPVESSLNTDFAQEANLPEESTVLPVPEEPTPQLAVTPSDIPVSQSSAKSSSWHRLGDVMAHTLKPKMPEVRYEEIGEPEVALPVKQADDSENFSEPEALDDEPLFLEEPIN